MTGTAAVAVVAAIAVTAVTAVTAVAAVATVAAATLAIRPNTRHCNEFSCKSDEIPGLVFSIRQFVAGFDGQSRLRTESVGAVLTDTDETR